MPVPLGVEEELRRLREFVEQLRALLQSVVDYPESIVPGRHHEILRLAWGEVVPYFGIVATSINSDSRPELEAAGLVGFRLRFELGLFADARAQLLDHAPELFVREPAPPTTQPLQLPPRPRRWRRVLHRLLKKCLGAGDVVLGSLAAVFPPAEIISQFKEGVEESIDLRGDR